MAATASRRPIQQQNRSCKCSHPYAHLIYDDPYIFQVRGKRARSAHYRPCDACLKEVDRQRALTANIKYEQRCSRLPPRPVYPRDSNRRKTASSDRMADNCTWDNFMKRKSKYAIQTPYASCDLIGNHEYLDNRPSFVNYGGHYKDKQLGHKRTFNSLAVHQLKHDEASDHRLRNLYHERHLRRQAEHYFRQHENREAHE
ncbi:unnamed protein product [Adineta ricciae]|uniref:Uncharacterized protein n=1 Tax=Adineta ricciae TaxID=249248 RepID=A0A813XW47_ADIRI|nr:unnamed protein product [Adineta ricciae]